MKFYQQTRKKRIPPHLANQYLRASSSIPLNLAEGNGKNTMKDRRRFFSIAFGLIRENEAMDGESFAAKQPGGADLFGRHSARRL